MKVLNYGSLNLDRVYDVPHFVSSQETILCSRYGEFLGGKGLNQSIALARAGINISHLGAVGTDGGALRECLSEAGVDVRFVEQKDTVSGHAIIQSAEGQNCIIVYNGANGEVKQERIREAINSFEPGDIFLLQNEVSNVAFALQCAAERGMKVVFNASPITPEMWQYPLDYVDYFLINEVEARALAGTEAADYEVILGLVREKYPKAAVVMTVGADGVWYEDEEERLSHDAYRVPVVDTTAAGDTFCGYFIAGLLRGLTKAENLKIASVASALSISQKGASNSIPVWQEVERQKEVLQQ